MSEYNGEVDKQNNACGHGVAKTPDGIHFEGTWLSNQFHGIGRSFSIIVIIVF